MSRGIKSDITCTKVSGASPNKFYGLQAYGSHLVVAFLRISEMFHQYFQNYCASTFSLYKHIQAYSEPCVTLVHFEPLAYSEPEAYSEPWYVQNPKYSEPCQTSTMECLMKCQTSTMAVNF